MEYIALLRGVNVGGKGAISMSKLKDVFEKGNYSNVRTYINSGNIILESSKNIEKLTQDIEMLLEKRFFKIDTVILSHKNLQNIVEKVPKSWKEKDLRKYVAFLKSPATPEELMKEVSPKEGVDFVDKGPGVVYLSTKMEGLTKSGFPKLITRPIYKLITMRNLNTVEKILTLMK